MFPRALKGGDRLLHAALCGELGLKGTVRPLHFAKWVACSLHKWRCRLHARHVLTNACILHAINMLNADVRGKCTVVFTAHTRVLRARPSLHLVHKGMHVPPFIYFLRRGLCA